ncbi:MAG: hypothetical protein ABIO46_10195 [Chitinophagales bacterium]
MRNLDIDHTFSAIRQAPLEVEYARIEQFVLQQTAIQHPAKTELKKWLNNTNITLLVIAITALMASLLLNRKALVQETPVAVEFLSTAPIAVPPLPNIQEKKTPVTLEKKTPPVTTPIKSSLPQKPVILTDVRATAAAMHQPAEKANPSNETPDKIAGEALSLQTDDAPNAPLRVRTYTSSYCNFEGEDAWIKAFLKALISDNIIRDTVDLRFTITLHSFSVNGKDLDEARVIKFNELYTAVTSEELNNRSKISLSVGGSSCTLTKVINE